MGERQGGGNDRYTTAGPKSPLFFNKTEKFSFGKIKFVSLQDILKVTKKKKSKYLKISYSRKLKNLPEKNSNLRTTKG